jgi:hypothetical protein
VCPSNDLSPSNPARSINEAGKENLVIEPSWYRFGDQGTSWREEISKENQTTSCQKRPQLETARLSLEIYLERSVQNLAEERTN